MTGTRRERPTDSGARQIYGEALCRPSAPARRLLALRMLSLLRRALFLALLATASGAVGCESSSAEAAAPAPIPPEDLISAVDFQATREAGMPDPVFHVGPPSLFARGHVPGSVSAGEAAEPEGLANLARLVAALPRTTRVIVYCGCCPYRSCPNVRPALRRLRELGFADARILDMPTNFKTDWSKQGFPVERN